ncbi:MULTISPECIES: hypothetical protein [unclassified Streptomyces]|uniref:hypothetical protein n=1 Tax=unclassified Streptomyces TaxID=2593676 RepID=UPI00036FF64D|nr:MULTISPECIES: hypothetical protein [unclassified Streptomyces]MYX38998.1 hypothetical protein [Streptomyces sp. SID8377]
MALHRVLPQVVEVVRGSGGLGQPEGYAEVMSKLPVLNDEFVDIDGQRAISSGADFRRVGPTEVPSARV